MEILDELQDPMAQGVVAGDVGVTNMASIAAGMAHHRHTPDSPMSHPEEDLSDPDRQDEESGEELPQQPMPSNNHSSTDNAATPTPLSQLNSLMSSGPPLFLSKKIKLERQNDIELNKSGLEALQAVMNSGGFNLPFSFQSPGAFLNPAAQQHSAASLMAHSAGGNSGNGSAVISSASSHSSESSQGSGRNGLESVGGGGGGGGAPAVGPGAGPGAASAAAPGAANPASALSQSAAQAQQQASAHQQQTNWSFEEQFKQVRQLYEINDDPKRKEFLDDLFSFMQKRGTPINRLPIMAKSVLDLYELYNLVIARGGLVDVINKKLWQEIIKGLHLPSSITSAAFTLRTQYMKYLYPYECEKKQLSTPAELQAAIDGNRREGRRSNYGAYGGGGGSSAADSLVHQRSPHSQSSLASLHSQLTPISLVTAVQAVAAGGQHQVPNPQSLVNGSAAHTPLPQHPHHPHLQASFGGTPSAGGIAPEFEVRMAAEYLKQWQRDLGRRAAGSPTNLMNHRQGSDSPPPRTPSSDAALFEMSRLTLWNMYNNNMHPGLGYPQAVSPQPSSHSPQGHPASPEPQKEALDLGLRSSPSSSSPARQSPISSAASMPIKRELEHNTSTGAATNKRLCMDEDSPAENNISALPGTHIKISNRGDGRDNSLVVSMELNGVMYQGVLFAQTDGRASLAASTNNNETKASSRNVVS